MLTRVYINNYRCLVNFEFRPGRKQLIMGPNGAGKSSLMDALLFLRRVVTLGHTLQQRKILNERTLWLDLPHQVFEIEASLDGTNFMYQLVIESFGDPKQPRIQSESVKCNGESIFDFHASEVHLFDHKSEQWVTYPFSPERSALATISEPKVNRDLVKFKQWFRNLLLFRINPFAIKSRAEKDDSYPWRDLSNFGDWYRHLRLSSRGQDDVFHRSLQEALDGFHSLELQDLGQGVRLLQAEFTLGDSPIRLSFDQLSDGQRCLVGLYAILHFVIAKGHTVIFDEPDNFIALREIQPWLDALSDAIDESSGQALIISHHPELMNQWAPDYGIQFIRDDMGPVRVKPFDGKAYSTLTPSEVVARGWENE